MPREGAPLLVDVFDLEVTETDGREPFLGRLVRGGGTSRQDVDLSARISQGLESLDSPFREWKILKAVGFVGQHGEARHFRVRQTEDLLQVEDTDILVFDMTVELARRQATETRRGLAEDVINVYVDSHRQLNSSEAHIFSPPQRVGSQKQIHNATPSDGRLTVLRLARKNDRNTAAARTGW